MGEARRGSRSGKKFAETLDTEYVFMAVCRVCSWQRSWRPPGAARGPSGQGAGNEPYPVELVHWKCRANYWRSMHARAKERIARWEAKWKAVQQATEGGAAGEAAAAPADPGAGEGEGEQPVKLVNGQRVKVPWSKERSQFMLLRESCAGCREAVGEALTTARMGRALSTESLARSAETVPSVEGNTGCTARGEVQAGSAVSETSRHARTTNTGNWEIFASPRQVAAGAAEGRQ